MGFKRQFPIGKGIYLPNSSTTKILENGIYGEIYTKDNTDTTTLNNSGKVQVLIFDSNGESRDTTPDHTNDHIIIEKPGRYLVTISLTIANTAGAAHVISLGLFKNNGVTQLNNVHAGRGLTTATNVGSVSMSGLVEFSKDDTVELWALTDSGTDRAVTFEDVTLSIIKIGN